jgi:uncharacterized membrane protein
MCFGSLLLSAASIKLDAAFDFRGMLNSYGIFWLNIDADGARSFLASISGALITVLGVVFSLTLLLISHVSSQFSPRVLTNFMGHKSIKFTLGILISTFLYNVLSLFSIRTNTPTTQGFVSETSLLIALILTTICVFTLIHFFNHIPQSIRLCNILKDIGQKFALDVKILIKKNEQTDLYLKQKVLSENIKKERPIVKIKSTKSGYLNEFLDDEIKNIAKENNCYIEFLNYLGNYIHQGSYIAHVYPIDPSNIVDEDFKNKINSCLSVDTEKQSRSDITYQADQMIEIAAKALSPGINDPHSANSALDWLIDGIFLLHEKSLCPVKLDSDKEGQVLYSEPGLDTEKLTKYIMMKSIPYFSADPISSIYLFTKINLLIEVLAQSETKKFLEECSHQMKTIISETHKFEGFSESESNDEDLYFKSNLSKDYHRRV